MNTQVANVALFLNIIHCLLGHLPLHPVEESCREERRQYLYIYFCLWTTWREHGRVICISSAHSFGLNIKHFTHETIFFLLHKFLPKYFLPFGDFKRQKFYAARTTFENYISIGISNLTKKIKNMIYMHRYFDLPQLIL